MQLVVPAVLGALDRVNALVRDLAAAAALPEWDAYRLRLVTEELFTNIVRHGYGAREPRPPSAPVEHVVIEYGVTDDHVWVRLIDTADPFDPLGVPVGAAARAVGGDTLGLDLIRRAASAASHEYVDGTNRTTVQVPRSLPAGPASPRRRLRSGPESSRRI